MAKKSTHFLIIPFLSSVRYMSPETHPIVVLDKILLHHVGSRVQHCPYDAQDIASDDIRVMPLTPPLADVHVRSDGQGESAKAEYDTNQMALVILCGEEHE